MSEPASSAAHAAAAVPSVSTLFQLDPDLPDVAKLVADIHKQVADNIHDGLYDDARIGVAERSNLVNIDNEDEFIGFYIRCLHSGAQVDINDFPITHEGGGLKGKLMVKLKTAIWKSQKFLTYRMWSQQNQINSFSATTLEAMVERYEEKIGKLEQRVAQLEADLVAAADARSSDA